MVELKGLQINFDHRDIRSLAAYLAAAYPQKIGALRAIRQSRTVLPARPRQKLAQLPRKTYFSGRLTQPAPVQQSAIGEQLLEEILWQEASFDDSYEKVTF